MVFHQMGEEGESAQFSRRYSCCRDQLKDSFRAAFVTPFAGAEPLRRSVTRNGATKASGAKSRMWRSHLPSLLAISANELVRPAHISSIQIRALAIAARGVSRSREAGSVFVDGNFALPDTPGLNWPETDGFP